METQQQRTVMMALDVVESGRLTSSEDQVPDRIRRCSSDTDAFKSIEKYGRLGNEPHHSSPYRLNAPKRIAVNHTNHTLRTSERKNAKGGVSSCVTIARLPFAQ